MDCNEYIYFYIKHNTPNDMLTMKHPGDLL